MVASEVAIAVSIEMLLRRTHLSLSSVLVYRSLLALVLLAIIVRPAREQWTPRSPQLAFIRVFTGGLTFVGWFGAIGLLSARVTAAILLLDSLILAYVRGERRSYERRTLTVLAAALLIFAAQAVREPGTVLNAPRGIMFLAIALVSRAASYKVWERAQTKDEHLFWLIAPALVGGALGGAVLGRGHVQPVSLAMFGVLVVVALVGLTGYFYMNQVMSMVGAFYTRVAELWQVPMLWAIHLITAKASPDWVQGVTSLLVCAASAYTFVRHRRAGRPSVVGR
jgi:drug/metabolite transporter (DMT)-like permease